jgi:hypothetical protein
MNEYQVGLWKRGTLEFRTEKTDDVQRAVRIGRQIEAAFGITYTVMIEDKSGENFCSYEWDRLAAEA